MNIELIVQLVKERLGIKTNIRDMYLIAIARGVVAELEDEKGLTLDSASPNHLIFVVDYASWRYQNKDSDKGMPRDLQFRLHNLYINTRGDSNDV